MDENNIYREIEKKIRNTQDIDKLLESIDEIRDLAEKRELSVKDNYQLQHSAFETIRELTETDTDASRAESIVIYKLLPICTIDDDDARIEIVRNRECLVRWLEQYPEVIEKELRNAVIEALLPYFSSSEPSGACWTASMIGYRDDRVVEHLWRLIRKYATKSGDVPLAVLAFLGVPDRSREDIVDELKRRIADHYSHNLCSTASQLADSRILELVSKHWLEEQSQEPDIFRVLLILGIFRDTLLFHHDDSVLQDNTWTRLRQLAQTDKDDLSEEIYRRDLISACNSPSIIAELLDHIFMQSETKKDPEGWRWISNLTFEDCVRPRQLLGWKEIDTDSSFWSSYRNDACIDTGTDTYTTSSKDRLKTSAWDVVLRAGYLDALNWFEDAVGNERGRFMQASIMKLFACFKIEPMPKTVENLITERHDDQLIDGDGRELDRRVSAVRIAQSMANEKAFSTLLDFGFTLKGQVLNQVATSLSDVAVNLAKEGNKEVESKLVEAVIRRETTYQSEAAAFALERVAEKDGSSLAKNTYRIYELLTDESRREYERSALLSALANIPHWEIPDYLWTEIDKWAKLPDRWLGGVSLEILARRGVLQTREDLLTGSLSLKRTKDRWDVAQEGVQDEWLPYFIGLLFEQDQEAFLPAVISIIRDDDWFPEKIMARLEDIYGPNNVAIPSELIDVIVRRVFEKQSATYSEPEIFEFIARLAPERLVSESWEDSWDAWLHSARVGLADALATVVIEKSQKGRAANLLQLLCLDSHFAVRRSAYRALSYHMLDTLFVNCQTWTYSEITELNVRAAEAYGWLEPADVESPDLLISLDDELRNHPEKRVRKQFKRTLEEKQKREWAKEYEKIVFSIEGKSNNEIASSWCYGEALARVGDDSTIVRLKRHLGNDLPINVRFWLRRIVSQLEKNWQDHKKDWPDSWFMWEGTNLLGDGAVIINGKESEVTYSIWRKRASAREEFDAWGGAIWPVPFTEMNRIKGLRLENGATGTIHAFKIQNHLVIFSGSGDFPEG